MPVGFMEGLSLDPRRTNWDGDGPRPLNWVAWYPAVDDSIEREPTESSWFKHGRVARDALLRPHDEPHPLVLLSHGTGGAAVGLEWLGRRLAARGFVSLAVNHHGNTGGEPYRPEGFLCLWERAGDLSAMLDDGTWRDALRGRIAHNAFVAGFSAGAYTAMLLIGARIAYSQFEEGFPLEIAGRGPREFPNLANHLPHLLDTSAVFRESWARRRSSFVDPRIRAAVALAPGRSIRGFSSESLGSIQRPVAIFAGDADDTAPAPECAEWLHHLLPRSALEILPRVGHYAFLPEPTSMGREAAPEVFEDAQGVSRRDLHDHVCASATNLFLRA